MDEARLARFSRLSDEDRVDELISEVTEEEVAQVWTRYQQRHRAQSEPPDDDDPDWWAVSVWLDSEWWTDERRVRDGILRLVDLAGSDFELEYIGISLMEGDFFTADPTRLDWIETQADRSDRFRRTLARLYLWRSGERVFERVERAARVSLPRPAGDA